MWLLFDIGGTKTRIAVSDDHKSLGKVKIISTSGNFRIGIENLKSIARGLTQDKKITAIGGGLAGSFSRSKEKIIGGGANIKGWVGKHLKQEFERAFGAPVYLENDASLAGLAEAVKGAGRGKEIVVYYTISTGFGGTRIVRREIDANARGFEPEYQVVEARKVWKNYRRGILRNYLGRKEIEMRFGKKPQEISDPRIKDELAKWLAIAVNNGILHWSPDIIVLGGSVMNIIPLHRVRFYLKKIYKGYRTPPPLVKTKFGDEAGLQGALILLGRKSF